MCAFCGKIDENFLCEECNKKFERITNVHIQKYKNKTLSIVGVSYTLACLMAGIIAVTGLPYWLIIGIIVATYAVRYLSTGFYYVLIKKYKRISQMERLQTKYTLHTVS